MLTLIGAALITTGVKHGYGRHVWEIHPQSEVSTVIMYDYMTQAFGLAASCVGRIAFIVYLVGLLGTAGKRRIILYVLGGVQLVTNIVSILILFLQCPSHGSAIWNRPQEDKCWDVHVQAYYGYFQGGTFCRQEIMRC